MNGSEAEQGPYRCMKWLNPIGRRKVMTTGGGAGGVVCKLRDQAPYVFTPFFYIGCVYPPPRLAATDVPSA